ncbi:MAG: putative PEP-binding protein, partial [Planctomycetota bacterium]
DTLILDGGTGEVFLRPGAEAEETFDEKLRVRSEQLARFSEKKAEPAVTKDGEDIAVEMNAGLVMDMALIDEVGAAGVGLFRTELQFLVGRTLPSVSEQTATYKAAMDAADGARVVFRTADLGSDKRPGFMHGPLEANPAMGWRGLRMTIDREGLLRMQLRALIAAAAGRPLTILLPLVTQAAEFEQARGIIEKELQRTEKMGALLPESLEIGAMIEIPSAAWGARALARQADFLSIGGNDLAQFFFAADRESDIVSARYDYLSADFISFLKRTADEARAEETPLGYCGEQAADPLMALALLGIGIDRMSVAASAVLPLKEMIRHVDRGQLREAVDAALRKSGMVPLRQQMEEVARDLGVPIVRPI